MLFRTGSHVQNDDPTNATSHGLERSVEFGEALIGLAVGVGLGVLLGLVFPFEWRVGIAILGGLFGLIGALWLQHKGAEKRSRLAFERRQTLSKEAEVGFEDRLKAARDRGDLDRWSKGDE